MKLNDARINILISPDRTTIELIDGDSSTTFARITLTPENLSKALSRQAHVECEINLYGLDRVGKTMEHKKHEFQIPEKLDYKTRKEVLTELIKETIPEGWILSDSFSSQTTFFTKDGKPYARATIRRYI